jgi:hypothetical protein
MLSLSCFLANNVQPCVERHGPIAKFDWFDPTFRVN